MHGHGWALGHSLLGGSSLPCPYKTRVWELVLQRDIPRRSRRGRGVPPGWGGGGHTGLGGDRPGWRRARRFPGDALASGTFRLWKYHLPAGIIQLNYRDNYRCGGEPCKNARVFRVFLYLFRRRKNVSVGDFPSGAKGPGPNLWGNLALHGFHAILLGVPLPAPQPPPPPPSTPFPASPEKQRLPESPARPRLLLVPPAKKMKRTVCLHRREKRGPVSRPDHGRDITCHNSSRAP